MMGKKGDWLLRWMLPLLIVALVFCVGCDELNPDEDEEGGNTAPPSQMLGEWHLFAGGMDGDQELHDLSALGIRINLYLEDGAPRYTMVVGTETSSGAADWRTRSGDEYLALYEGSEVTELAVLAYTDEILQVVVPDDEDGDQFWVMAKGSYLVAGLITDATTQRPIAAANITVTDQLDNEEGSGMTADLGIFLITELDIEALRIEVSKDGYTSDYDWFTIEVDRPAFMSFALMPSGGSAEGTVIGVVTDSDTGDPIEGVTITSPDLEHQDVTSATGEYVMILPTGQHTLMAVKDGYESVSQTVTVTSDGLHTLNFELTQGGGGGSATISGLVTASQSGQSLAGVTISVVGDDVTATTDASGMYSIVVPEGLQQIRASIEGYYNLTLDVVVVADVAQSLNFSLSPVITSGSGGIRLVLTWGASPNDLDSHLLTPEIEGMNYHVYFGTRGDSLAAPYARLDVDDTSGFGPETITIYQSMPGVYRYYIYNWSGTPSLAGCGAQVQMYNEDGLIQTVTIPATGEGRYWYICDIDGTDGTVDLINDIREEVPTFTPGLQAHKVR